MTREEEVYCRGMDAETWFKGLEGSRKGIDLSLIDMNDERTRYILSK